MLVLQAKCLKAGCGPTVRLISRLAGITRHPLSGSKEMGLVLREREYEHDEKKADGANAL